MHAVITANRWRKVRGNYLTIAKPRRVTDDALRALSVALLLSL